MFNKILASIGIGAAKVQTKLDGVRYTAGDVVSGIVEVTGGNVEQNIDTIYITLYTTYIKEIKDTKYTDKAVITRFTVSEPFTIQANEKRIIPFKFNLPYTTPISVGKTQISIQTELDIKMAIDPKDKDYIEVLPSELASGVFNAVSNLGFRRYNVDCEKAPLRFNTPHPFIQEFEYRPTNSKYRAYLDELEVTFINQSANHIEVLLQIDRRVRGLGSLLSEALEMDESFVRLTFTHSDIENAESVIQQAIERHI